MQWLGKGNAALQALGDVGEVGHARFDEILANLEIAGIFGGLSIDDARCRIGDENPVAIGQSRANRLLHGRREFRKNHRILEKLLHIVAAQRLVV